MLNKSNNCIHMALDFAGVVLPVQRNEQGHEVVPLKPISDVFGLEWADQHKKMKTCIGDKQDAGSGLAKRLGACLVKFHHSGQLREMLAIRLDRVAAYLYSVNPDKVRAGGNAAGADFLEEKQTEWDDVLHAYERSAGIFSPSQQQIRKHQSGNVKAFLAVNREKRVTKDERDLKILNAIARALAEDMGFQYPEEQAG